MVAPSGVRGVHSLPKAGHWLGFAAFVNRSATERVLPGSKARQYAGPVGVRQSHWPGFRFAGFVEPMRLGRDLGIKVGTLDTLETGPLVSDAYEAGMRRNLKSLQMTLP